MKKLAKSLMKLLIITISILFLLIIIFCATWVESEKTSNISNYDKYFGIKGKHNNDIFPKNIPPSANVEDFYYYYYNPFDPNYVSYLVYTCDDEDFKKETERLRNLKSSKDYMIYGATGFNYPISAIYSDDYNGYIYALEDAENNRLIYVEIYFCNYFSDIKYEQIIADSYLPINFNAKFGNVIQAGN